MSKYSQEFKLKVIHHYLASNEGFIRVALSYGLHLDVLRKWVHAYQLHGEEGLSSDRGLYTQAFKLSVLRYKEQRQLSANGAAMHFNVASGSTIASWQRLYNERGAAAFKSDVLEQSSPISKAIDIKKILKIPLTELGPAKELGKQEQVQVITGLRQHYGLEDLVLVSKVPRSVYYHRLKAGKRPDRHLEVKEQIDKIFYQHKGRYGCRRVHLALRNDACYLNHKTVQRLMSQLGLKASAPPKRHRSYRGAIGKAAPNLLARQFSAKQ